jgi:UDP-N-acetylmuramate dehydrogenase
MPLPPETAARLHHAGLDVTQDAPLARRTWWQVGGPADGFLRVGEVAELATAVRTCHDTGCPLFVLGNGTNLLISDRGIRGLVVQLGRDLATAEAESEEGPRPPIIVAGGGTKLVALVQKALRKGWTGLEVFAGIPGTVGGAVRMNAGARLGETRDVLIDALVVLPDGSSTVISAADLHMAYRTCHLPPGAIVASARFATTAADPEGMRASVQHHLEQRAATQPLDLPSCGSTFRNPPGDHAGRLIEAAGLKGFRLGDAQVSTKHANFIVNLGAATADQLLDVLEHVERTVFDRFGVALHREVHLAGDWSHRAGAA